MTFSAVDIGFVSYVDLQHKLLNTCVLRWDAEYCMVTALCKLFLVLCNCQFFTQIPQAFACIRTSFVFIAAEASDFVITAFIYIVA